ncbi:MAG: hypothetical protein AABX32_02620 [Nanoarchaeota archaeon]
MESRQEELEEKCLDGQIRYVIFLTHHRSDYSFWYNEYLQCRIDSYHSNQDWWEEIGREQVLTTIDGGLRGEYGRNNYHKFNGELAKKVQQKFPFGAEHRIETLPKNGRYGGEGPSDPFVAHFRLDRVFLDDFLEQFSTFSKMN